MFSMLVFKQVKIKYSYNTFSTLVSKLYIFSHFLLVCLGGHIKVRVPGATIARKNTCVIITPQYYAPK